MQFITTNIRINRSAHRKLRYMAAERGRSMAELVREAVDEFLTGGDMGLAATEFRGDPIFFALGPDRPQALRPRDKGWRGTGPRHDPDRDPARSSARDRDPARSSARDRDPARSSARDRDPARGSARDRDPARDPARDPGPGAHAGEAVAAPRLGGGLL